MDVFSATAIPCMDDALTANSPKLLLLAAFRSVSTTKASETAVLNSKASLTTKLPQLQVKTDHQKKRLITLHERTVLLLTRSEVSALRIRTLAKNKILNIATRATVSDKNVKCKQSDNLVNKGENHTKVISSPPKRKEMMEISASE